MITGKDYLETLRIQDETIYDNVEGMHSLEYLLDDFLKENQAKDNEVLDLIGGLLPTIEDSGVVGLTNVIKCTCCDDEVDKDNVWCYDCSQSLHMDV